MQSCKQRASSNGPAGVACSGSHGSRTGVIGFDGRRSRDVVNPDDRSGYPVGARGTTALATWDRPGSPSRRPRRPFEFAPECERYR